jgi:hypothetical protein
VYLHRPHTEVLRSSLLKAFPAGINCVTNLFTEFTELFLPAFLQAVRRVAGDDGCMGVSQERHDLMIELLSQFAAGTSQACICRDERWFAADEMLVDPDTELG